MTSQVSTQRDVPGGGDMYGRTYGRNKHPYVMRWEGFGSFGADAQKKFKEKLRIKKD
jgi:hypothetical protein